MNNSYDFSTYAIPPEGLNNLMEIEKICNDRLKLYKILQEATLWKTPYSQEWNAFVVTELKNQLLFYFLVLVDCKYVIELFGHKVGFLGMEKRKEARHIDLIGHYFLSLVYCRNNEDARTFIKRELEWFKLRFTKSSDLDRKGFLRDNECTYQKVCDEEKDKLKQELLSCNRIDEQYFEETIFFKVKFYLIPEAVRDRYVFLHHGYAFFSEKDVIYCLHTKLTKIWEETLNEAKTFLKKNEDERLIYLMENVELVSPFNSYRIGGNCAINLKNIEVHAKKYYPLCMRNLHNDLKWNSHLKHGSRMQYGVFLKNTGMEYEQAMEFWEREFTKKMSTEDFYKHKYAYYFKHQYGRVGGRIEYPPQTCEDIINNIPGPGQKHGCPFAHFDKNHLVSALRNENIKATDLSQVIDLTSKTLYRQACTKFCESTCEKTLEKTISSPGEYYSIAIGDLVDIEDLCKAQVEIFEDDDSD